MSFNPFLEDEGGAEAEYAYEIAESRRTVLDEIFKTSIRQNRRHQVTADLHRWFEKAHDGDDALEDGVGNADAERDLEHFYSIAVSTTERLKSLLATVINQPSGNIDPGLLNKLQDDLKSVAQQVTQVAEASKQTDEPPLPPPLEEEQEEQEEAEEDVKPDATEPSEPEVVEKQPTPDLEPTPDPLHEQLQREMDTLRRQHTMLVSEISEERQRHVAEVERLLEELRRAKESQKTTQLRPISEPSTCTPSPLLFPASTPSLSKPPSSLGPIIPQGPTPPLFDEFEFSPSSSTRSPEPITRPPPIETPPAPLSPTLPFEESPPSTPSQVLQEFLEEDKKLKKEKVRVVFHALCAKKRLASIHQRMREMQGTGEDMPDVLLRMEYLVKLALERWKARKDRIISERKDTIERALRAFLKVTYDGVARRKMFTSLIDDHAVIAATYAAFMEEIKKAAEQGIAKPQNSSKLPSSSSNQNNITDSEQELEEIRRRLAKLSPTHRSGRHHKSKSGGDSQVTLGQAMREAKRAVTYVPQSQLLRNKMKAKDGTGQKQTSGAAGISSPITSQHLLEQVTGPPSLDQSDQLEAKLANLLSTLVTMKQSPLKPRPQNNDGRHSSPPNALSGGGPQPPLPTTAVLSTGRTIVLGAETDELSALQTLKNSPQRARPMSSGPNGPPAAPAGPLAPRPPASNSTAAQVRKDTSFRRMRLSCELGLALPDPMCSTNRSQGPRSSSPMVNVFFGGGNNSNSNNSPHHQHQPQTQTKPNPHELKLNLDQISAATNQRQSISYEAPSSSSSSRPFATARATSATQRSKSSSSGPNGLRRTVMSARERPTPPFIGPTALQVPHTALTPQEPPQNEDKKKPPQIQPPPQLQPPPFTWRNFGGSDSNEGFEGNFELPVNQMRTAIPPLKKPLPPPSDSLHSKRTQPPSLAPTTHRFASVRQPPPPLIVGSHSAQPPAQPPTIQRQPPTVPTPPMEVIASASAAFSREDLSMALPKARHIPSSTADSASLSSIISPSTISSHSTFIHYQQMQGAEPTPPQTQKASGTAQQPPVPRKRLGSAGPVVRTIPNTQHSHTAAHPLTSVVVGVQASLSHPAHITPRHRVASAPSTRSSIHTPKEHPHSRPTLNLVEAEQTAPLSAWNEAAALSRGPSFATFDIPLVRKSSDVSYVPPPKKVPKKRRKSPDRKKPASPSESQQNRGRETGKGSTKIFVSMNEEQEEFGRPAFSVAPSRVVSPTDSLIVSS